MVMKIKWYAQILIILLIHLCNVAFPQITINHVSALDAASYICGQGVIISNATFNGNLQQLATFSGSTNNNLGITDGIVLTTGQAEYVTQPNTGDHGGDIVQNPTPTGWGSDADLSALITYPQNLWGPGILEFDIKSFGTQLQFNYIFGSAEYNEYVGTDYNDVFGIFISGPGISGPYSNNGINLALIPGTSDPISVNTVNNGYNNQGPCNNCAYFINNENNWATNSFVYDGYTVSLTGTCNVQCLQTYHVRIAISNVNDNYYDSGVLIKKGSFSSDFVMGPIIISPNPACEGQPITLSVQGGANNYYYVWSTGDEGTGLSTISTLANLAITNYSVTITNNNNCQMTLNSNINVHADINMAPYVNGINNTGEYHYYAYPGPQFCFDIPSFDSPNEIITMSYGILPQGASLQVDNANHPTGTFCWAPNYIDIGLHSFTINLLDNNVCGNLPGDFTFYIHVLCPDCPVGIYYENRTPLNNPLPSETKAAQFIIAGEDVDPSQTNGPVETGNATVKFQAGEFINLEPGFTAGPNFHAIIDPTTCTQCNCCENWNGFTVNSADIPNVITPNGDQWNEVWYVPDVQHPFCAFNAFGFNLEIKNIWGAKVYTLSENTYPACCQFRAPSSSNPIPYSSIYWNGRTNSGEIVADGVYYYVLDLFGCNNSSNSFSGTIQKLGNPPDKSLLAGDTTHNSLFTSSNTDQPKITYHDRINIINNTPNFIDTISTIKIFPNPSKNVFYIQVSESIASEGYLIEVYDAKGILIKNSHFFGCLNSIDLTNFAVGIYLLKILSNKFYYNYNLIKQ
jgi:hypothetical protein